MADDTWQERYLRPVSDLTFQQVRYLSTFPIKSEKFLVLGYQAKSIYSWIHWLAPFHALASLLLILLQLSLLMLFFRLIPDTFLFLTIQAYFILRAQHKSDFPTNHCLFPCTLSSACSDPLVSFGSKRSVNIQLLFCSMTYIIQLDFKLNIEIYS